ncbi:hypothetical protein DPMN_123632 [Dreissena polymorpha]|uniref:Uncharacterized protein n=1 Tax=Dreissena polymorpha TaxID=45954 RepID=A0A9D4GUT8_DREPO|nr:hypothetical protein DPMN_123632 [Dreissena polymorpha]
MWSNSWKWDNRGNAKPLDPICTCNIQIQQCDAGFAYLVYTESPQHKDTTEARIKSDAFYLENMQRKIATCARYTSCSHSEKHLLGRI